MRILIIYRVDHSDQMNIGVTHKMNAQVKAFSQYGGVAAATLRGGKILLNEKTIKEYPSYKAAAIQFYKVLKSSISRSHYDFIYIRYGTSTPSFIHFLSSLDGKIVIEIPTYPYHKEFRGLLNNIRLIIDKIYRRKLKNHIHAFAHLGPEKEIFNIPTIHIQNGIDVSLFHPGKSAFHTDQINMVAVGKWALRHGLDRLIRGIYNYYNKVNEPFIPVYLRIIGDGPELDNLKNQVINLNLENRIFFHGVKSGVALDQLYEDADMGVGILAFHRVGVKENSAIKHREYLARGLPVLKAGIDKGIDRFKELVNIPSDEADVDIQYVIDEYLSIINRGLTKDDIREKTKNNLDWSQSVESILKKVQLL